MNLRCIPPDTSARCDTPAEYWVWFKDVVFYTYACEQHLAEYIAQWSDTAYPVVQATRIATGEVTHYDQARGHQAECQGD